MWSRHENSQNGKYFMYVPSWLLIERSQMTPYHTKLLFVGVCVSLQKLILNISGHLLV